MYIRELGTVVHTCNHNTQEAGQKNQQFRASLGYKGKPYWKNKKYAINT